MPLEKLVLALVHATRKLPHYFQAHTVYVLIKYPLQSSSTEGIPRLIKVELVAEPSINVGVDVSLVSTVEPCWMDPIINFLAKDRVPTNKKEAEKVR